MEMAWELGMEFSQEVKLTREVWFGKVGRQGDEQWKAVVAV